MTRKSTRNLNADQTTDGAVRADVAKTVRQSRPTRKSPSRKARRSAETLPLLLAHMSGAGDGLLLGRYLAPSGAGSLGFRERASEATAPPGHSPVTLEGEGHVLTIAPTGAGKGRGSIIPNLLRYEGSAIVLDPKGEAAAVTARRRREMGHDVRIIDPFGLVTKETDSLNPFDIFNLPGIDHGAEAEALATLLSGNSQSTKEPFWDIWGRALCAGVIAAVAETEGPSTRNFSRVRDYLKAPDPVYALARLLEQRGSRLNRLSQQEIGSFLQLHEATRSGVIATAQSYLSALASDAAAGTLMKSSVDLEALREGRPMTIYLVIPPSKLTSHASLLRLWVSSLISAVMARTKLPELRTLFIIDECAQLGKFDLLPTAVTLARGYGMRVWCFFQDMSQLKRMYPTEWQAVVTSSAVMQVFGIPNHLMARELADVIGDLSAEELRKLPADQQAVMFARGGATKACLLDYLNDPEFQTAFDPNPMFIGTGGGTQGTGNAEKPAAKGSTPSHG